MTKLIICHLCIPKLHHAVNCETGMTTVVWTSLGLHAGDHGERDRWRQLVLFIANTLEEGQQLV